jgi:hypothetical protein
MDLRRKGKLACREGSLGAARIHDEKDLIGGSHQISLWPFIPLQARTPASRRPSRSSRLARSAVLVAGRLPRIRNLTTSRAPNGLASCDGRLTGALRGNALDWCVPRSCLMRPPNISRSKTPSGNGSKIAARLGRAPSRRLPATYGYLSAARIPNAIDALQTGLREPALCATSGASPTNVRNSSATAENNGLSAKNAPVTPCTAMASAGTARSGLR